MIFKSYSNHSATISKGIHYASDLFSEQYFSCVDTKRGNFYEIRLQFSINASI